MENENIIDAGAYNNNQLSVSPIASSYLNETGRWGKFLAIVGFCTIGLLVVIALFAGTALSALSEDLPVSGFMFSLIYLLLGLLYFFPVYYLLKFSNQVRAALATKNSQQLDLAFENLKSFYKFWGILTIIMLGLYVLALVGGFLAADLMV